MNNKYYTYAYLREDRTPYYIGKGHGNRLYRRSKRDIKPPRNKSRTIILKQNLTEEEAFRHEIYMIDVFGRIDLGTGILRNRTNGGEGMSGFIPSEETKEKISAALKGKTLSPEHKAKIAASSKGRTHSPETKEKMRGENNHNYGKTGENHPSYGKTLSPEHKAKISAANKGEKHPLYGKTFSPEHRAKLSASHKGENNHLYGKTHSTETKAKQSAIKKGKTHSPETLAKLSAVKKGKNNPNYGKIWITDGNINLMILKTDNIPEGFRKGKKVKSSI
jgi:hypothetical protein